MNMKKEITQITFTLYFDIIFVDIIYNKCMNDSFVGRGFSIKIEYNHVTL